MSYIEKNLKSNEDLKLDSTLSFAYLVLNPVRFFMLLCTGGIAPIWSYISNEFAVTNKRVVHKHGIIGISTNEMNLDSIETVNIEQGILGRILSYGTLIVTGRGSMSIALGPVSNPHKFRDLIDNIK